MRNTKQKGQLRFLVYKSGESFTGVCFELGLVDQEADLNELLKRLKNGAEAMVKAVIENGLDDSHLNKKVASKYYFFWYCSVLLKMKDVFVLEQSKRIENFSNWNSLAPSCV